MRKLRKVFSVIAAAAVAAVSIFSVSSSAFAGSQADGLKSVVYITPSEGSSISGSGFAIGVPGQPVRYVITNWHVINHGSAADAPIVYFSEAANRFVRSEIKAHSESMDLCLLKLPEDTTERRALPIAQTDGLAQGEECYTLGFPSYADAGQLTTKHDESDIVISKGIISKRATINVNSLDGVEAFLVDATINGGNSGGPLVNNKGEVIGVNTWEPAETTPGGFAITASELIRFLNGTEAAGKFQIGASAPEGEGGEGGASSGGDVPVLVIVIAIVAVVVVAAAVIVIVMLNKKKSGGAGGSTGGFSRPSAGAAAKRAVLTGVKGELAHRTFEIGNGVIIGRNPSCGVVYGANTQGVSGTHCQIKVENGMATIMDLGSSYGTTVNGITLAPNMPSQLTDGAIICMGSDEQVLQFKMV